MVARVTPLTAFFFLFRFIPVIIWGMPSTWFNDSLCRLFHSPLAQPHRAVQGDCERVYTLLIRDWLWKTVEIPIGHVSFIIHCNLPRIQCNWRINQFKFGPGNQLHSRCQQSPTMYPTPLTAGTVHQSGFTGSEGRASLSAACQVEPEETQTEK